MAFFGRVGNILKQATSRKINSELCSFPSSFQAIRCFSNSPSTKLFIGGVSYNTDDQSLGNAFSKYGQVLDARIIKDHESGRSRGFGFVTFSTLEEASSAIQAMDGQDLHGRQVKVNFANERPRVYSYGSFDASAYGNAGGNATGGVNTTGYAGDGYESDSNPGNRAGNNYGTDDNTRNSGGGYGYGHGSFPSGNTYNGGTSGGYGANSGNYAAAAGVGAYGNAGGNATGGVNTTRYPGDGYESNSNPGNRAGNNYGTDDNTRNPGGGYGYGHGSFPSGNTYNGGTSDGYGANSGNYAAAAGVGESNTVNYGSAPGGGYGNYGAAAPGVGNSYNYDNSAAFGSSSNNFNVAGGGSSSEYSGSATGYGTFGVGTSGCGGDGGGDC